MVEVGSAALVYIVRWNWFNLIISLMFIVLKAEAAGIMRKGNKKIQISPKLITWKKKHP